MSLNRNELADGFYFTGLLVLVTGLPLSMFLMSISQGILMMGWLLSGGTLQKLKHFFTHPVTIIISSVYLLHLAGFLWSDNLNYAMKDARIKIPMLLLPLVISTYRPLTRNKFYLVLYVFIGAVLLSSFVSMAVLGGFTSYEVNDIRDVSIFISHIRFGLLINIAIFSCLWIWIRERKNQSLTKNLFLLAATFWLVIFLVIIEAMTGLIVLMTASLVAGLVISFRHPNRLVKSLSVIPVLLIVLLFFHVREISNDMNTAPIEKDARVEALTVRGNPYQQLEVSNETENGHLVWNYICPAEIDSAWPVRSSFQLRGKDKKGQTVYFTLIRYLTSKGLRKDADGIMSLTADDVKAIEAGNTNFRFTSTSDLNARIYQIVWEYNHYRKYRNPEGHSVMQRLEFWKAGWNIFRDNPLMGVGTGDVPSAFDRQYLKQQTRLAPEWRLRAHNQFLTFALTFGAGGLCFFIFSLFYPYFKLKRQGDVLYSLFLLTAVLSFMNEDTLETQAGVTFFAFFNSFLLFGNRDK